MIATASNRLLLEPLVELVVVEVLILDAGVFYFRSSGIPRLPNGGLKPVLRLWHHTMLAFQE